MVQLNLVPFFRAVRIGNGWLVVYYGMDGKATHDDSFLVAADKRVKTVVGTELEREVAEMAKTL